LLGGLHLSHAVSTLSTGADCQRELISNAPCAARPPCAAHEGRVTWGCGAARSSTSPSLTCGRSANAGIENLHWHDLRHPFASADRSGADGPQDHRDDARRDDSTQGASGSEPRRSTRAPARGPSATRSCTAARESGERERLGGQRFDGIAVVDEPAAEQQPPDPPRDRRDQPATSAALGGGRRWKRSVPSAPGAN